MNEPPSPPLPTLYYVYNLIGDQCRLWVPLLPVVGLLVLGPASPKRRLAGLLALFISSWLLVISLAKTKHEWYVAPIMPALALLLALGLGEAYTRCWTWLPASWAHARWRPLLGGALAVAVLILPYGRAFYWLRLERQNFMSWGRDQAYSSYVRDYQPAKVPAQLLVYYPNCYPGSLQFYQEALAYRGVQLSIYELSKLPAALAPGARVLVCLPDLRARLLRRYAVRLVDQRETCTLYEVTGAATPPLTAQY